MTLELGAAKVSLLCELDENFGKSKVTSVVPVLIKSTPGSKTTEIRKLSGVVGDLLRDILDVVEIVKSGIVLVHFDMSVNEPTAHSAVVVGQAVLPVVMSDDG